MKTMERPLVKTSLDPLQFAYQADIGVDDAIIYLLHGAHCDQLLRMHHQFLAAYVQNVHVRKGQLAWPPVPLLAAFSRTAHPNSSTLHCPDLTWGPQQDSRQCGARSAPVQNRLIVAEPFLQNRSSQQLHT
ncbi:unnamed protein product [Merluccius merluccius]